MKTYTLLIFVIFSLPTYSQSKTYNYEITYTENILSKKDTVSLIVNNNCSFYFSKNNIKNNTKKLIDAKTGNFKVDIKTNNFVHKTNQMILSSEHIFNKRFLVTDSLINQKWQVTPEIKRMLGYSAYKAIGSYKGRNYIVWFTTEIPVNNGPWKFGNLPGLIIKVEDEDKEVFFDLLSIKNLNNDYCNKLVNTLTKENIITRNEYESLWRKKLQEFKKFINSSTQEKDAQIDTKIKINLIEKSILEDEN